MSGNANQLSFFRAPHKSRFFLYIFENPVWDAARKVFCAVSLCKYVKLRQFFLLVLTVPSDPEYRATLVHHCSLLQRLRVALVIHVKSNTCDSGRLIHISLPLYGRTKSTRRVDILFGKKKLHLKWSRGRWQCRRGLASNDAEPSLYGECHDLTLPSFHRPPMIQCFNLTPRMRHEGEWYMSTFVPGHELLKILQYVFSIVSTWPKPSIPCQTFIAEAWTRLQYPLYKLCLNDTIRV